MVETRLKLEKEVQEIFKCVDVKRNFLLSGGAGSGKTYSLVQTIRQSLLEKSTAKIACITYTNAAVKEISDRINHKNLSVSTIHDFLWENIKHFQKELKEALVILINDPEIRNIKISNIETIDDNFFDSLEDGIQYKEYLSLGSGIISHDELLIVANYLFEKHPKLSEIVQDKYDLILVDEYQDTSKLVVEIFLNHFKKTSKKNVVGFFGDAMQSIYDDTVGNLNDYVGNTPDKVMEIKKEQNRRNPQKVIDLANRLRTDGIIQVPSVDKNAPNMTSEGVVKSGDVKFLYSTETSLDPARDYLGWDFANPKKTKELNLTHNLIAEKAGFVTLMGIYDKERIIELKSKITKEIKDKNIVVSDTATFGEVIDLVNLPVKDTTVVGKFISENKDLYERARSYPFAVFKKIYIDKDNLLDDKKQDEEDTSKESSKRDALIAHLFKIQKHITLYNEKKYNEFLRVTDFDIKNVKDKESLKDAITELTNVAEKTIGEIIDLADTKGLCLIDDNLNRFKQEKEYIYERVAAVPFVEFQKLYDYLEGKTPFSTQHKTKGSEFDNVFIVLDNGGWNNYNFTNLFLASGTETVLERTQKIFYVCCTRAKENLAVFFHSPTPEVIEKAKEWFGEDNVVSLT
jgi:DNA helicase-2/ATP-dependent DNA helicase PcrA